MGELGDGDIRYLAVGVVDHKLFVRRRWYSGQQEDHLLGPVTGPVVWFEGTLLVAGDGWVHDLTTRTLLQIPRGKVDAIAVELLTREYLLRIQPSDGPAIWKALSSTVLDSSVLDFMPPTGHVVAAHGDRQVRLESADLVRRVLPDRADVVRRGRRCRSAVIRHSPRDGRTIEIPVVEP